MTAESAMPPAVAGLASLADRYDGLIVDLWGTVHNGVVPFPGVPQALAAARAAGKRVVLVTNAPRRAAPVAHGLVRLGITDAHYDAVLSAGEVAWHALATRADPHADPWHASLGRRCFHIGPARDLSLMEGNGLERTTDPGDGEFVLVSGPFDDSMSLADHDATLAACRARGLKLVSANPDREVIRGETRLVCAGAIAERYAELGGDIRQHGKPYRSIYDEALGLLAMPAGRVLAIGDGLATDIAGAAAAGIDSAFIPGGIHGEAMGIAMGALPAAAAYQAGVAAQGPLHGVPLARPTWMIPALRW
jgi:HAD superfamily hydrolase (TIGR01459 family)